MHHLTGIDLLGNVVCLVTVLILVAMLVLMGFFVYAMECPEQFAKLVTSIKTLTSRHE